MCSSIGSGSQSQPFGWALGRFQKSPFGPDAAGRRSMEKLTAFERTRSTDVQLQVQTDEGDTVTLTLHRETDVTMLRYRAKSRDEDGKHSTSLDLRSVTRSQEVSIQVEGDLNEQERADLDKLVARVVATLPDAVRGGDLGAFAASTQGSEFESLAGYALSVSRSETFDAIAMRRREWRSALEPVQQPVAADPPLDEPVRMPIVLAPAEVPAAVDPICLAPGEATA